MYVHLLWFDNDNWRGIRLKQNKRAATNQFKQWKAKTRRRFKITRFMTNWRRCRLPAATAIANDPLNPHSPAPYPLSPT